MPTKKGVPFSLTGTSYAKVQADIDGTLHAVTITLTAAQLKAIDARVARDDGQGRPLTREMVIIDAITDSVPGLADPRTDFSRVGGHSPRVDPYE